MYSKLGGMTGTASTEAEEFGDIYKLEVVEVPTNVPIARIDEDDEVYRTVEEKYQAIINDIKEAREKKQPVLVGTTSIEKSEILADLLRKGGVQTSMCSTPAITSRKPTSSQAGVPGAITIATNMAGRGTDIQLGGNADMRIAQELGDMPEGNLNATRRSRLSGRNPGTQGRGAGRRRPLRSGHRAPRKPPHRQPAAWPLRPSGRPWPLEVLPVAAR
jgi:hypothetical protein